MKTCLAISAGQAASRTMRRGDGPGEAHHTGLVRLRPRLGDYVARCLARPAFDRALGAQLAAFERTERRKNLS